MATKTSTPKKPTDRKAPTRKPKAGPIDIPVKAPAPIQVRLGDEVYAARRVKGAVGLSLVDSFQVGENDDPAAIGQKIDTLIDLLFSSKDAERVRERLTDPADALDYPHIVQTLTAVVEAATGNPTT